MFYVGSLDFLRHAQGRVARIFSLGWPGWQNTSVRTVTFFRNFMLLCENGFSCWTFSSHRWPKCLWKIKTACFLSPCFQISRRYISVWETSCCSRIFQFVLRAKMPLKWRPKTTMIKLLCVFSQWCLETLFCRLKCPTNLNVAKENWHRGRTF